MKKLFFYVCGLAALAAVGCSEKDPYVDIDPEIVSFSFQMDLNESAPLFKDYDATIDGTNIRVALPEGTKLENLVATFETNEPACIVTVDGILQVSDLTVNDFSEPVDYLVSLGKKKNALYTVTVSYLPAATWKEAGRMNEATTALRMEINKKTGKPAIMYIKNVESARGPVMFLPEGNVTGTPVQVSPEGFTAQYLAFGIGKNGRTTFFTHNYLATSADRYGAVFCDNGDGNFAEQSVKIALSNNYYGPSVGTLGEEIFVMTSNNTAGVIAKRNINVTSYDGAAWTTDQVLCGRPTTQNSYFPIMRVKGEDMYVFVTDVSKGFSIYKYSNKEWSEVIAVDINSNPELAEYSFALQLQDMVIADDGIIYLGLGAAAAPYKAFVLKVNPSAETAEGKLSTVGSAINLTSSIASRWCRIALSPLGKLHMLYRNDNQQLVATSLNADTLDWEAGQVICTEKCDDVNFVFDAKGVGHAICYVPAYDEVSSHVNQYVLE